MCITNTGPGSKRPTTLTLPPEFLADVSGGRSGSSLLVERLAKALPSIRYQSTAQQASKRPTSSVSGIIPTSSYPSNGTSSETPQEFNRSTVPSSPISTAVAASASPTPLPSADYSSNTYLSSLGNSDLRPLSRKRSFDAATSAALDAAASVTSAMVWPSKPAQHPQGQNCLVNADEPAPVLPPPKKKKKQRRRKPQKPGKTAKMNDRHFVKHDYHDHSHDDPNALPEEYITKPTEPSTSSDENKDTAMPAVKPRRRGGVAVAFPLKLHAMLRRIESDGLSSVIGWQPHGRAFLVKEPERFVKHVMPTYFRQTKLTSFQRQLNLYGFSRLTKGPDNGAYYHELFLKGKPFLCKRMVRTKVKGTGFKAASSPDSEPDFYKMPPVVDESQLPPVPALLPPAQSHSSSDESGAEEEEEMDRHTHHLTSAPKNKAVAAAQRRRVPVKGAPYAEHISSPPNQAPQNPTQQQPQQHPPPKLKPLSAPAFFLSPRHYPSQPQLQCSVRSTEVSPRYSANVTMPFPFNAEPRAHSPTEQSPPIRCKPYQPRNVGKPYRNPFQRVPVAPPDSVSSLLPAVDAFPPPSRKAFMPVKQEETAPPQPENTSWSPPHCVSDSDGNHSETSGEDEASRQVLDEVVDELFLHDGKMGIIGAENGAEAENVMLDFVKTWDPEHHLDDTAALEDVIQQDVEDDGFDWNQDVEDDAQLGMMLEKLLA